MSDQNDFERGYNRGRSYDEPRWRDRDRGDWSDYDFYQETGLEQGSRGLGRPGFRGESGPSQNWWAPGPYTGRGPRNYRRSDERIRDDIYDGLTQHGWLDASDITVDVSDGEVSLSGTVPDRRQKRLAEDIADSVFGVRDVHNQLRIGEQGIQPSGTASTGAMAGGPIAGRTGVHEGERVFSSDGQDLGSIKEVRATDFLLQRTAALDVYVPFSAAQSNDGNRITLDISAEQLYQQGWTAPAPMPGTSQT